MPTKDQIIKQLVEAGIQVPKGMSLPELNTLLKRVTETTDKGSKPLSMKKDFMACLADRRKATLLELVIDLGGKPKKQWTKGDMLLWIREEIPQIAEENMNFGKYKALQMQEVASECEGYVAWALKETNKESQPQLRKFTAYCKVIFRGILKDETDEEENGGPVKKEDPKAEPKEEAKTWKARVKLEQDKAEKTPVPTSDNEDEEDPKKFRRVPARAPPIRPQVIPMTADSDSSAKSWMELSEKRKHQDKKN